ncbi:MAG: FGGY-family carbohydrate kinase [Desulfohalobiaceae bacterium]|nr:FGGY-family carbohydrate kinase [Desulfohalobiaceae bacterium]
MRDTPYLLSIDNGTQSVRALVFDALGNLLFKSFVPVRPYYSVKPGWAEQDPEYFWDAICRACRGLWTEHRVDPGQLAGVAVTTQRTTMVNLDREGNPLRPAIIWLDQRRVESPPSVGPLWGALFRAMGVNQTVRFFLSKAADNWIAVHQPRIWEKTRKYLLLSGYVHYRLTGEYRDSRGCQVGYLPFDYKRQTWARDGDWKWRGLHVRREMLPELVGPGEVLGEVSARAAEETGLRQGTPVIAAATDKACEVLGSGCIAEDQACLGYGTTATVSLTSERYVEPFTFLPPYPAAIPGCYNPEVQNFRGFWLVSWFKEQFGSREQAEASRQGKAPEELLDEMLDRVPPGSAGLTALPYWTPGVKIPGPEAKGAIIGFGDIHTRAHVYRAILEGLVYSLREGKERLEKRSRRKVERLMVAGGGSRSDRVMRITADIFGLPAIRPHVYETSGLGAAINAAVGLDFYSGHRSAIEAMTRVSRQFEPDRASHEFYHQLYSRVYKRIYSRLKPLYQEIQAITGYPGPDGRRMSGEDIRD